MQLKPAEERIADMLKVLGQEGTCKGCGAKIWWVKTKNDKPAPYTEAGINHFSDCPDKERFRKPQ